jgi:hypothetical protein
MKAHTHCRSGTLLLSLCLFSVLLLLPLSLNGQPFFSEVENVRLSEQQQHYLQTIKDQPASIDYRMIRIHQEALNKDFLNLTIGGKRFSFVERKTTYRDHDDYSWSGDLNGPFGRCNLVVKRDMVTAVFHIEDELFMTYPLGEGLHVLVYYDQGRNPPDCGKEYGEEDFIERIPGEPVDSREDPLQSDPSSGSKGSGMPEVLAGSCKLRLLVAFTDDVDDAYADIQAHIQAAVDDFNDANDNSEVNYDVELARSMEVFYNESADDLGVFLNDFETNGDGKMDDVHDDRSLFDADVCVLMTLNDGNFCGLASGIGSNYSTAFCVSVAGCSVGNHTFAHEIGHLHGCRHDPYVDSNNSPYAYGHGYVYFPSRWRTIMAYNNECDCSDEVTPCPAYDDRATPGSPSCTRLQNWSTPDVTQNGVPMGTAATHKNERVLDETMDDLSHYEAYILNKSVYDSRVITNGEEFDIQGSNSLTTEVTEPFTVNSGAKGSFRAGSEITLKEGFWARSGSEFRAYLDSCTDLLQNEEEEAQDREEEILYGTIYNENAMAVQLRAYPNPFEKVFLVEYRITQKVPVTIQLIDITGKPISTIVDYKTAEADQIYQVSYDGSQLPAGAYQLIIQAGNERHNLHLVKMQ